MTPSDRIHRNARMILEAATWRGSPGARVWCIADDELLGHAIKGKVGWEMSIDPIHRDTARTILRGILAPRVWAELRRSVEELAATSYCAIPLTGEAYTSLKLDDVLAIMDDIEGGKR